MIILAVTDSFDDAKKLTEINYHEAIRLIVDSESHVKCANCFLCLSVECHKQVPEGRGKCEVCEPIRKAIYVLSTRRNQPSKKQEAQSEICDYTPEIYPCESCVDRANHDGLS